MSEWISVEDRLPELFDGGVLIMDQSKQFILRICLGI